MGPLTFTKYFSCVTFHYLNIIVVCMHEYCAKNSLKISDLAFTIFPLKRMGVFLFSFFFLCHLSVFNLTNEFRKLISSRLILCCKVKMDIKMI